MEYNEEDFLMLSGLQHFAFCRRQWALVHIDQLWDDNLRTTEGNLLHEKCHDGYSSECRRDVVISRGILIFSRELGVSGECDVVEFRSAANGVPINGRSGLFEVYPVEYKHGKPKDSDIDILQLVGQAMCLEEMLCCTITSGAIFYGETKHRIHVDITPERRVAVKQMLAEMHMLMQRGYVPKVKPTVSCKACSLKDLCLPSLLKSTSVHDYLEESLGKEAAE
jgi:CRISPR-associated exonuclease Cas4